MDEMLKLLPEEHRGKLEELNKFAQDLLAGNLEINEVDGKKYTPGAVAATAKYAREEWDGIKENDLFLVSFPKTGTNWCVNVLWKIITDNNPKLYEPIQQLPMTLLAMETGEVSKFQVMDSLLIPRRVIVTHVDGEDFPVKKATDKGAKIICILRNPKDQTVSWYHFAQTLPPLQKYKDIYPEDWKKFTELYFAGKQGMFLRDGDWYPEHILSWYKHKHQDNVKFVYFEDMKKDLEAEVTKMAKFLDVKLDKKQISEITKSCGFDAMKNNCKSKQGDMYEAQKSLNTIRKGKVGDWKDYFTVSQSEAIDAEIKQKLANTDIKFTYEL